mmetsp:Transcript_10263/g.21767  ORF Transcript_10263/g.21767 Transcript_10263/m.21767 type:complete len:151 (-) Transcript_10263:60-512(-)
MICPSLVEKELQNMFIQTGTDADMASDFIDSMDKDGDGTITFYELLKELYPNTLASRLQAMYKLAYPDAPQKQIKQRKLTPVQLTELKEIYELYDTKGDGVIDRQELFAAFANAGYSDHELETLFVDADKNKDGVLDLEEFIEMFRDCYK